jgi:hypothetical protein
LGVLVPFVGVGESFELLGDQPADRGAALGCGHFGAVDDRVVELDGEVSFAHQRSLLDVPQSDTWVAVRSSVRS